MTNRFLKKDLSLRKYMSSEMKQNYDKRKDTKSLKLFISLADLQYKGRLFSIGLQR